MYWLTVSPIYVTVYNNIPLQKGRSTRKTARIEAALFCTSVTERVEFGYVASILSFIPRFLRFIF